jgi:hypothetical protein
MFCNVLQCQAVCLLVFRISIEKALLSPCTFFPPPTPHPNPIITTTSLKQRVVSEMLLHTHPYICIYNGIFKKCYYMSVSLYVQMSVFSDALFFFFFSVVVVVAVCVELQPSLSEGLWLIPAAALLLYCYIIIIS